MADLVKQEDTTSMMATVDVGAGGQLQVASDAASAIQEVQAAVIVAKKFPRNENVAFDKLMTACKRKTMAVKAAYSFPRGGTTIKGPSVNLARLAGQCWGNVRWGLDILRDEDTKMHIRGWAWDLEANSKITADDVFKKLIYRKKGGWITPDERDLRELINRRGAFLVRNCLLQVIRPDLIEDAMAQCVLTIKKDIKDPKSEAKHLILDFQEFGVTAEMLNGYIGGAEWNADDIVSLTEVLNALKDGQSKVADYFGGGSPSGDESNGGSLSAEDMKAGDPNTHQGHEPEPKPEKQLFDVKDVEELEAEGGLKSGPLQDARMKYAKVLDLVGAKQEDLQAYGEYLTEVKAKKKEKF